MKEYYPIIAILLILASFGLYYYFIQVPAHQDELVARNFRVLGVMGNQVKAKVENLPTIFHHWRNLRSGQWEMLQKEPKGPCQYIKDLVEDFTDVRLRGPDLAQGCSLGTEQEQSLNRIQLTQETSNRGHALIYQGEDFWAKTQPLEDMIDEVMRKEVFDAVVLLDSHGTILFQHPRSARSFDIASVGIEGADSLTPDRLSALSGPAEVTRDGISYHLFAQSLPLSFVAADGEPTKWIMCGFVRTSRLVTASLEFSYNTIIGILFLVSILALSWPLLKVWTIGPYERLRRADVSFLLLATFAAISFITMFLLHLDQQWRLEAERDQQLEDLSQSIKIRLSEEIDAILEQLAELQQSERFTSALPQGRFSNQGPLVATEVFGPSRSSARYPYLSQAFWTDAEGNQRIKWSAGTLVTPFVNVRQRTYYQRVQNESAWSRPGRSDFFIEPVYSNTTGESLAVVATEFTAPQREQTGIVLSAAISRLRTLTEPILPPGFGFAVVEPSGSVLFHSDSRRALEENFLLEIDDNERLASQIVTGTDAFLNAEYFGRDHRLFVTPIGDCPWSLIVFSEDRWLQTTALETLTVAISLSFSVGLLVLILFGITHLLDLPRFTPCLWAAVERPRTCYVLIGGYLILAGLMTLAGRSASFDLYAAILGPFVALTFTLLVLVWTTQHQCSASKLLLLQLPFVTPLLAVAGAIVLFDLPVPSRWCLALPLLVIIASSALLLFHGLRQPQQESSDEDDGKPTDKPPALAVVCAATLLGVIIGAIPSVVCFRKVAAFEERLYVRSVQRQVAESLQSRYQNDPVWASLIEPDEQQTTTEKPSQTASIDQSKFGIYTEYFYNSQIFYDARTAPSSEALLPEAPEQESAGPLVRFLNRLRPTYNHIVATTKALIDERASDGSWTFLSGGNESRLYHAGAKATIRSDLPRSNAAVAAHDLLTRLSPLGSLIVVAVTFLIALFVLRKTLLIGFVGPLREDTTQLRDIEESGERLLVRGRPFSGRSHTLREQGFKPVPWPSLSLAPSPFPEDKALVVDDFERAVTDAELFDKSVKKLDGLLKLQMDTNRSLVLISTMDPTYYFAYGGPLQERDRFDQGDIDLLADMMGAFTTKSFAEPTDYKDFPEALQKALDGAADSDATRAALLTLKQECSGNFHLQKLAIDHHIIDRVSAHGITSEQVPIDLLRRARSYYQRIWSSLSRDEKLVLFQVANNNFVNPNSHPVVRELIRKQLVRPPDFSPMNESFRVFIQRVHEANILRELERESEGAGWNAVKRPLLILLVGVIAFLVFTQQEVRQSGVAYITTIAALLSAIIEILGRLGASRRPRHQG